MVPASSTILALTDSTSTLESVTQSVNPVSLTKDLRVLVSVA